MLLRKRSFLFFLVLMILLSGCQSLPALPGHVQQQRGKADVRLAAVFNDHMVLQRNKAIPIWGTAKPGQLVEVWLDSGFPKEISETKIQKKTVVRYAKALADEDGKWRLKLGEHEAGGPFTLTVKGEQAIAYSDVLIGEVWLCSGQSNMVWSLRKTTNAKQAMSLANYPQIRIMDVARVPSPHPVKDVKIAKSWTAVTPDSIKNFSAVGYYFGRAIHQEVGVPVGLILSAWGGTRVEPWMTPEVFNSNAELAKAGRYQSPTAQTKTNRQAATQLYNGMIEPLVPYGIRGVIWYQGESNRGQYYDYEKLFTGLIHSWRSRWNDGRLPFYFAQLAPYNYGRSDPRALPMLYDAQLRTHKKTKYTGMAVLTDIGNTKNIHPRNKLDVGNRLARWALVRVYGKQNITVSGPLYKSFKIRGDKIRVIFDYAQQGLISSDGKGLTHFTIAGSDRVFHPAVAKMDGLSVIVSSAKVRKPVAVRFCFHDEAVPNFFNQAKLPASPFRTDDWPLKKK